jgi:hypothetical protein
MLKSLHLQGIGPVKDLQAQLGERLSVLTGDNGLGKSFLLDICFWALTGSWPGGRVALPDPNGPKAKVSPTITFQPIGKTGPTRQLKKATFDFHSQSWGRPAGRPIMPGLVIYAAVDGGFVVWDPARNYWRDPASGQAGEAEQPRAYQFTPATLADGLTEGSRVLCNGLLRDWVSWYYQRPSSSPTGAPIELLEQVIRQLAHPQEVMNPGKPRRVYVDDAREIPTVDMPYGNVAFPHLSAGVRRIVSLAYLIVWAWTEHCQAAQLRQEDPTDRIVLIVDEIEAHLHPKWQRVILPSLLRVAAGLGTVIQVQIITATHSPLVLASVEPLFDEEQDRLFLFDLHEGEVTFESRPWSLHGDVVGWLTSDLFGLQQARSREAEEVIEAAEAFMRGEKAALPDGLRTKEEIHQRLLKLLPGLDPFWPRWIVKVKHDAI